MSRAAFIAALVMGLGGLILDVPAWGEAYAVIWCIATVTCLATAVGTYNPKFDDYLRPRP